MLIENVREYTVSEITTAIKKCFDVNFNLLRVKGEISGLKIASSGHCYFNLKEKDVIMPCVCWKHIAKEILLEEGFFISVQGKIGIYQGKYQINVDKVELAGIGSLIKVLEERKKKLEHLFSQKRKLPLLPKKIGIITSITGAVIHDIINRVKERFPLNLIIWPVSVQGQNAASDIVKAIEGFNEYIKPDVIIIARGGGSMEDLWSFNEEILVHGIYKSLIPTISAVGHETDFTLCDFVADVRASTPTAAAEIAVPVKNALQRNLDDLQRIIISILRGKIAVLYSKLANKNLSGIKETLIYKQQNFDEITWNKMIALQGMLNLKLNMLNNLSIGTPTHLINFKKIHLEGLSDLLQRVTLSKIKEHNSYLKQVSLTRVEYLIKIQTRQLYFLSNKLTEAFKRYHHNQMLKINVLDNITNFVPSVLTLDSFPVFSVKKLKKDEILNLKFIDGYLKVKVLDVELI